MVDHTFQQLIRKRSKLLAQIDRCQSALSGLMQDVEDIDAQLRQLSTDSNVQRGSAGLITRRRPLARRDAMISAVMSLLHEAEQPLTTRQIAALVLAQARIQNSPEVANRTARRVLQVLCDKRAAGLVRSLDHSGPWLKWEVVKDQVDSAGSG